MHIYKSVCISNLLYGSTLNKETRRITTAEIRYLKESVGKTRTENKKSSNRKELKTRISKNYS